MFANIAGRVEGESNLDKPFYGNSIIFSVRTHVRPCCRPGGFLRSLLEHIWGGRFFGSTMTTIAG